MRRIKAHIPYFALAIFWVVSCTSGNKVEVTIVKATSNYPKEKYSWYQAPPRIDFVFEVRNISKDNIAIPMQASLHESLPCSTVTINLYQITGKKFLLLKPGESKAFALKSNHAEIQKAMNDCKIEYPGDFFIELLDGIRLTFTRTTYEIVEFDGIRYKIPQKVNAVKSKNFQYEVPKMPIEE